MPKRIRATGGRADATSNAQNRQHETLAVQQSTDSVPPALAHASSPSRWLFLQHARSAINHR